MEETLTDPSSLRPTGPASSRAPAALPLPAARIAIIDDEPVNVKVVRKYLQNVGYREFVTANDSREAMALLRREQPDVVLLDVMMPHVDGIQILREVRADPRLQHIPVLILTASTDSTTKQRALESGATDFLAKPVDPSDLVPRIRNALIVKAHHDHLSRYSSHLEQQVRIRTAELEASRLQVIHCLARAAEYRDDTTGRHVLRVGRYAAILAREAGFSPSDAEMLGMAAQLHDVGKIGLPDSVLLKPGALLPEEFEVVKRHCEIGHGIINPPPGDVWHVPGASSVATGGAGGACTGGAAAEGTAVPICDHPLLQLAALIALTHHEKWDGSGYPRGLAGEAIPIEGRLVAVADVFDALSSARSYKPALPPPRCLEIMLEGRGKHFDPAVLDAFVRRFDDVLKVHAEQADAAGARAPAPAAPAAPSAIAPVSPAPRSPAAPLDPAAAGPPSSPSSRRCAPRRSCGSPMALPTS